MGPLNPTRRQTIVDHDSWRGGLLWGERSDRDRHRWSLEIESGLSFGLSGPTKGTDSYGRMIQRIHQWRPHVTSSQWQTAESRKPVKTKIKAQMNSDLKDFPPTHSYFFLRHDYKLAVIGTRAGHWLGLTCGFNCWGRAWIRLTKWPSRNGQVAGRVGEMAMVKVTPQLIIPYIASCVCDGHSLWLKVTQT